MKRIFIFLLIAATILFDNLNRLSAQTDDKAAAEITHLRSKLAEAVKGRDRKTLETFYAADFTHTHASGQVDDRANRINALVSGDQTIESAPPDEVKIRTYNEKTAVAVGQSTLDRVRYRWTICYVKTKKDWQVVASQATRIAEK